jgi:hypothetical protein
LKSPENSLGLRELQIHIFGRRQPPRSTVPNCVVAIVLPNARDRRIHAFRAAGAQPVEIDKIVRHVYRVAGYGGPWKPEPGKIRVTTDVCQEKLSAEESDIRPFSDDQNIVIGHARGDQRTNYLPAAHWVSGELGRQLSAQIRGDTDLSSIFGPDSSCWHRWK